MTASATPPRCDAWHIGGSLVESMSRTVIALRRSPVESTLKAVAFDQLALPTACVNQSGQVLAANAAFASLAGTSLEQLIGRTLFERVDPSGQSVFARRWARLLHRVEAGEVAGGVVNWLRPDGAPIGVRVEARPAAVDVERIALPTVRDVGAEHLARRERRLQAAPRDALAAAESPAFLLCAERRGVAVNAAAESLKQDPALEFAGLPFDDLRSIGGEYGSGFFYYSRPLPPQTILDSIELGPPAGGERSTH